jgi:hypothetical protein
MLKIEENADIQALVEIQVAANAENRKEKQKTLKVHKEADWVGKKVLFISFDEKIKDGTYKGKKTKKQHQAEVFEKDAATGYWLPIRGPVNDADVELDDPELAMHIRSWRSSGKFAEAGKDGN